MLSNISVADAGSYSAVVSSACGSVTNSATLTVYQNVAISSPPSSLTNCPGTSATYSVTASGSNLNYQWRYDGSPISGATNSSYTIPSISAANVGSYDVVVSNSCSSVTSTPASLTFPTPVAVARNVTITLDATGHATIIPHRRNRVKPSRNDGRKLRRYRHRWRIERTNAWLHCYRGLAVRWAYYPFMYGGIVYVCFIHMALQRF